MPAAVRLLLPLVLAFLLPAVRAAVPAGDAQWRLELVKSAARKAGLEQVGLDHRDLYGVIHAESGWLDRDGMGKNGVVSVGVAQFEAATARAVGLRDRHDPVKSVEAAAVLMREAAQWSARKLEGAQLAPGEWALRLREGVSIYYNLSSRARSAWNGRNSHTLPVETQHHIRNARHGALIASRLEGGQPTASSIPQLPATVATVRARPQAVASARAPQLPRGANGIQLAQGYIQWSNR
jgi:hypothetical protein